MDVQVTFKNYSQNRFLIKLSTSMKLMEKAAAIRQALQVWDDNMTDLVIFMDADGSYSFE